MKWSPALDVREEESMSAECAEAKGSFALGELVVAATEVVNKGACAAEEEVDACVEFARRS